MMKTKSKFASLAATLAICAVAGSGVAQAKVYEATGKAKGDTSIQVSFELNANARKGALSRAVSIGSFNAENVPYRCSATGYSGRAEYSFLDTYTEPVVIAKNGKFKDVDERSAGGHLVERTTLDGQVTGAGKFAVIRGLFRVERSEGGLEFNNCATPKVAFTARVPL